MGKDKNGKGLSESFIAGVIAIVFLIVGFQAALFIHRAAVSGLHQTEMLLIPYISTRMSLRKNIRLERQSCPVPERLMFREETV